MGPAGRLLSNGRYTALITATGGGVSMCDGRALTAWSADPTGDDGGLIVYLRDADGGDAWSAGAQPIASPTGNCTARYEAGSVVLERRADAIESTLTVVVADDDCELRRLTLRNAGSVARRIEVTSYAEVVLNDPGAQAAHPAFAKLFVQTERVAVPEALLAWRRPRAADERHPWMVHAAFGEGSLEAETDRARFLGRGRTRADPQALSMPLSDTCGPVLDPVFSLRRTVSLQPGGAAEVTLLLGMAPSRAAALDLVGRHADPGLRAAAFARAAAREPAVTDGLGLAPVEAEHAQAVAAAMLFGAPSVRAPSTALQEVRGSLDDLAPLGIARSGLVVVALLDGSPALAVLDRLRPRLAYWRTRALRVQSVVVCGGDVRLDEVRGRLGDPDAVVLAAADLSPHQGALLAVRADLYVPGMLPHVADPWPAGAPLPRRQERPTIAASAADLEARTSPEPLLDWNGHGGFSVDGREYVVRMAPTASGGLGLPPMPWANVVANQQFGFLVSERGAAHTWSQNSHEHRVTPWSNDPVGDPYGEALYVRDRESGACWCPQGGPLAPATPVEVRHGLGFTRWLHRGQDLDHEVCAFVPQRPADPLKLVMLRLTNRGARPRSLTVFAYFEWVLGVLPQTDGRFVRTEIAPAGDVVRAVHPLAGPFADRVAFAAVAAPPGARTRATADRHAFLGTAGSSAAPAAVLDGRDLDATSAANGAPCAALQVDLVIPAGATVECVFVLGEGRDEEETRALLARYRRPAAAAEALHEAREFWQSIAAAVTVETPEPAIDRMVNGWLPYQIASCRVWGRTAFYQSGGAFGFRDQLQDAAALVYARPDWTRAQILLHAGHQFQEGDVLHWWHPPADRGIRTHFSDDLLWLPYVTAFYVATTGDTGVLDARAPFVTARALAADEDEAYLAPLPAGEVADVYTHCCRALDRSLRVGAHGIPLMGTGDWNDGMNRVGREGRGQSVWLGFFLYRLLADFVPLCERRGDAERATRYRAHRAALAGALEDGGWDGAWYRRAYYDDGTPLGSASNQECRIDVLVQAWAVLSGAAPPERAAAALDAAERLLVSESEGIIRLLTPPFDRDSHDPGYIKGYIPGIRENGGQYTHAALWAVQAFAVAGRRDRAARLLTMLSPVTHARSAERLAVYQVEPYVVAADVYGTAPHVGRGGWTWYTGSAGWMLRVALESVLGVRVVGGTMLTVKPCIPDHWPGFTVRLRLPDGVTRYEVTVRGSEGSTAVVHAVEIDGVRGLVADGAAHVALAGDGRQHRVAVTLGARLAGTKESPDSGV